jgi:MOSC domain-containing protein YiiM
MDDAVGTGRLEAIWLKRAHRGVMDPVDQALLVPEHGLEGSVDRSRRRQVTVLDAAAWRAALGDIGAQVDPSARRANLLVSGLVLAESRGRILQIGNTRLRVGGELTPCERMDEAQAGLQQALRSEWRGGVFTQVLTGGTIRVGDPVRWESGASGLA